MHNTEFCVYWKILEQTSKKVKENIQKIILLRRERKHIN